MSWPMYLGINHYYSNSPDPNPPKPIQLTVTHGTLSPIPPIQDRINHVANVSVETSLPTN